VAPPTPSTADVAPTGPAPGTTSSTSRAPTLKLAEGQHFQIDPVIDGATIGAGAGFCVLLEFILSTGEIKPQVVAPGDSSKLLSFDKTAVSQSLDPNASLLANIGLGTAIGYAVLDSGLSGYRDGFDAFVVDAMMYGESGIITLGVGDLTKIAVRRPRPIDYINPSTTDTNAALSFFSGHSSEVSALGATATYIAFMRSNRRSVRPWLTLAGAAMLTTFVDYERVRGGAHFPSDVIVGTITGTAIGILVPHLHRHIQEAPPVWLGVGPTPGGATVNVQGIIW
jgi:undecaprenyl-diphosphatase